MQKIKQFIQTHPHMWWGLILPLYLTVFFTIEHFITENYWATQTAIDAYIPFLEIFAIPYGSWSPILAVLGIYLIIKDPEGFRRYMWFIGIAFLSASLFCVLVPNGQDLRPAAMPRDNICTWIMEKTYAADTNTNVFPSVHVLGVIAAISALWHTPKLSKGWKIGGTVWECIILASTLFVKQHAFVDVAAGLAWGTAVYAIVYILIGKRREKRGWNYGEAAEKIKEETDHDHSADGCL